MILDEPTAVLSEPDAELLIKRVMNFRSEGKAVLYATNRLSEAMQLADRITILRDGKRVGVYRRGELSRADIIRLMAKDAEGHANGAGARRVAAKASDTVARAKAKAGARAHIQIR
ncbi:MAG TPA: hypothetical protein VMF32_27140 [Xanthobacteraceae bacterium]|nr:hypothetical protein [Xanthobacteraceae bacterium]